ncbi:SurA N-terminal domain-containing protein [Tepidamorphus sp. 3E244]|uniref:SurA N-terminal domain-containing protein n=1 Tax=Tepidamorphus sp. 3E244 TaxID=3385498 RepID=UPI0038FCFD7A
MTPYTNTAIRVRATFGLVFAAAIMLAINVALPATASAQTRVVALVNDEPITSYDVSARAKFLSVVSRKGSQKAMNSAALEELIEEKLKFQEAKRLGLKAQDSAIESAYGSIAQRLKMSSSQLTTAFKKSGVNPATLRQRLEADLVWADVVRQRFREEVRIREQDVLNAMGDSDTPAEELTTQYELQKIIVILPKDVSQSQLAQRMKTAQTVRSQFQNCDSTHQLTQQFEGVVWDRFGRKVLTVFDPEDQERLKATGDNQMTEPRRTKNALEMYAVCSRREIKDDTAARKEAQSELMNDRGQVLARRLLIDLKQSALIVRK